MFYKTKFSRFSNSLSEVKITFVEAARAFADLVKPLFATITAWVPFQCILPVETSWTALLPIAFAKHLHWIRTLTSSIEAIKSTPWSPVIGVSSTSQPASSRTLLQYCCYEYCWSCCLKKEIRRLLLDPLW